MISKLEKQLAEQGAPFNSLEGATEWLLAGHAKHGFKEFKDTAEYKRYYPVALDLYAERLQRVTGKGAAN